MNRRARRRHLAVAERELADAYARLDSSTTRLRVRIASHSPFTLLGIGAATGAIAGRLPLGAITRLTRTLASASLFLLRIPANAWIGAARMHARHPTTNDTP
jgi:hypothetical protein